MPTDSHISNTPHDREQQSRARQAAEALFRPSRPATAPAPASTSGAAHAAAPGEAKPAEVKPAEIKRTPRIFSTPQVKLAPQPQEAAPAPRPAPVKRRAAKLAPADHVRIRTLADYGMTPEQVAEHFGVAVEVVERSLAAQPAKV